MQIERFAVSRTSLETAIRRARCGTGGRVSCACGIVAGSVLVEQATPVGPACNSGASGHRPGHYVGRRSV